MIRFALFIVALLACVAQAQPVALTIEAESDDPGPLFVAGSHRALGGWKADGLAMTRDDSGLHRATISLDPRTTIEFKITRGSWPGVEKNADGSERGNRVYRTTTDPRQTIRVKVERFADGAATTRASSIVGRLVLHENIESKQLGNRRTIRVWLPAVYDDPANADRRFGVIYMHDGQNLFDDSTSFSGEWRVDETISRLIDEKKIDPVIVVGIDNTGLNRINEYTPLPMKVNDALEAGGRADDYLRFVVETVKPMIDRTYRTGSDRDHTTIAGSSLGGLVSVYAGMKHPDVFGKVAALSPSVWWADEWMTKEIERDATTLKQTRIWIDTGDAEGDDMAAFSRQVLQCQRLGVALSQAGVEVSLRVYPMARHNEAAWANRFDGVILFLLGRQTP